MVREVSQIDYLVDGINRADGIRDAVDVVEKLNEILYRKQIETDTTIGVQQKKNAILGEKQAEIDTIVREQQDLVNSIRAKVNGNAAVDTKIKADALGNAVKRRIAEEREQGREIDHVVVYDNGVIEAGNSKNDGEDRE